MTGTSRVAVGAHFGRTRDGNEDRTELGTSAANRCTVLPMRQRQILGVLRADLDLMRCCHGGAELDDRCEGMRDQQPSARPGRSSRVLRAVTSPGALR